LNSEEDRRRQVVARVRSNGWYAGFAAALLLFFGYGAGLSIPAKGGLYTLAGQAFIYTLQAGGILMALVAVLCLIGLRQALYLDALVSLLIGTVMALSSLVQLLHGEYYAILYLLIAAMFLRAAVRNYQEAQIAASLESAGERPRWQDQPAPPPRRSIGSELIERLRGPEGPETTPMRFDRPNDQMAPPTAPPTAAQAASQPSASSERPPEAPSPSGAPAGRARNAEPATSEPKEQAHSASRPAEPEPSREPPKKPQPAEPPPGGFLAALAKQRNEQQ
jgi:hypothetical protein